MPNRTSHLPLSGHMLLCVRNRGGLRDVLRGWGEGGGTQTGRTVRNRSPSASLFAAFTQGAVVGGGGPRRNNVSFHPPPIPTPPQLLPHLHTKCAVPAARFYTPTLSHTQSDCGGGGTESRRNNKILMSRGRESRPLVCTKGSTKPQKWNECAINVHLSCAWRGSR